MTHLDQQGSVHMVDIGGKPTTARRAIAEACVILGPAALAALADAPKGDVLATVRIAGIMGCKRTSELIPLCHPLSLSHVAVDITREIWGLRIACVCETVGPTGVEMEAMTGASIAALTLYDMLKGVERGITIGETRLLEKHGGQSGDWQR
jgi:cyclic pyranopterin phosphate synthase